MPTVSMCTWIYVYTAVATSFVQAAIYTHPIGGNSGYTTIPTTVVRELGLKTAKYVDQIRINGKRYGENGGTDRGSITLGKDEYINKVEYRYGWYVDWISFCTNQGRCIGGGGSGGPSQGKLENIRVIAIGGKTGWYVDKLDIMYISGYQPSQHKAENVGFILAYTPPFGEMEEYVGFEEKSTESYTKVLETMASIKYDASIQGEFMAKATAGLSSGFEMKHTTIDTFKSELERRLEHKITKKQVIPAGHVGVKLVVGELLQGANGTYWVFPTSVTSYSVINISEPNGLLGHYDLTGVLYTQIPELKKHKKIQHGYVYYVDPSKK